MAPPPKRRELAIAGGVLGLLVTVLVAVFAVRARRADDPMQHVRLARAARQSGNLGTATAEAVTAVRLEPENNAALRELATIAFVQQNYTSARTFYIRAIKADPNDQVSKGYLGCTLIRLGRVDEGTRWVQRAGKGLWSSCAAAR